MVRRTLKSLTLLTALGLVTACNSSNAIGGNGDNPGGDSDRPGVQLRFSECIPLAGECATGLECAPRNNRSFCLETCTLPAGAECEPGEVCRGMPGGSTTNGVCLREVEHYQECGNIDACPDDSLCLAVFAPSRCIPVCAAGNSGIANPVSTCPAIPTELTGQPVRCEPLTFGTVDASFCVTDVAVGERCDDFGFRCDPDGTRPDSDPSLEPSGAEPDPGTLRCLPSPVDGVLEPRCQRVCSNDGGANVADCGCPAADPACEDPTDPGLAWSCEGWGDLNPSLRGCALKEPCTANECDDNAGSGMTACAASPFSGASDNACASP